MSSNPFGGTSYSFGSSSNPFKVSGGSTKKSSHPGGFLGLLDNFANDAEQTVTGFIPGVVHTFSDPIGTAKAIGHDYATRYGPLLLHGDLGAFIHQVDQHPLSFLLDAATVATLGAGAGARLGVLSGTAGELALRSPGAISEGLSAEEAAAADRATTVRTSHNPLIRLRQNTTHSLLGKIPGELGKSIETARYSNRVFKDTVRNKAAKLMGNAGLVSRLADAGSKLSENEIVAHNLRGPMVPPDLIIPRYQFLRESIHKDAHADLTGLDGQQLVDATKKRNDAREDLASINHQITLLQRPEVQSLFFKPSERMQGFRELVKQAGEVDAEARGIPASVREDHRWARLEHIFDLAQHDENPAALARPGDVEKQAFRQGIKQYLHSRNIHDEPIYIPDAMVEGGTAGKARAKRYGNVIGMPNNQVFKNKQVLFDAAKLAFNAETMTPQLIRGMLHSHAIDLRDTLAAAGRKVPAESLAGWERRDWVVMDEGGNKVDFLTRNRDRFLEDLEKAGDNEAKVADVFHGFLSGDKHPDSNGMYTIVPKKLVNKVAGNFKSNNAYVRALWDKPATIWKTLILGLRPAFAANLVVGNSLMYALHFAGPNGFKGLVHAVGHKAGGDAEVAKLLSHLSLGGAKEGAAFLDHLPEMAHSSFSESQVLKEFQRGANDSKLLKAGKAASRGVFPLVAKLERRMRVAAMEAAARSTPEIKAALDAIEKRIQRGHKLPRGKTPLHAAMDKAFEDNPALRDHVASQVNNAMGNYHAFTSSEQSIARLSPFYAFYKHVVKSSADLALNKPGTVDTAVAFGDAGHQENEKLLGKTPDFLGSLVGLGSKDAKGHLDGLVTTAFNPYITAVDLGKAAAALGEGNPGRAGHDVGTFLHPFLTAGIEQATGKTLLTGSPTKKGIDQGSLGLLGGIAGSVFGGLPQAQLLGLTHDALTRDATPKVELTPTGRVKKKKDPLYQHNWQQLLLNYLGVPYRDVNVNTAQSMGGSHG